jgi:hypothetical protein
MLRIRYRITDNILEEDLENTTGLLVDKTRDTFHTATTGETANSLHIRKCQNRKEATGVA